MHNKNRKWLWAVLVIALAIIIGAMVGIIIRDHRLEQNMNTAIATGSYVAPTAEPTVTATPTTIPTGVEAPETIDVTFACDELQGKCTIWIEGGGVGEEWFRYRLEVSESAVPWAVRRAQLHLQLDLVEVNEEHVRYEKTVGGIPIFVEGEFRPQADYAPQILVMVGAGDWKTGALITLDKNIE